MPLTLKGEENHISFQLAGPYIWLLLLLQRQEDGKTMMCDLPDEVLRYIFVQLADHQDLVNAGLTGSRTFALSEENSFWRRLCMFHFTSHQWNSVLRSTENIDGVGWKQLYSRLLRYCTMSEVSYLDINSLQLCVLTAALETLVLNWEHAVLDCCSA